MNFHAQLENELRACLKIPYEDDGICYYQDGSYSGVDLHIAEFHELTADEITVTFHVKELSEIEESFTWQPERECNFEVKGKLVNILGNYNPDQGWKIQAKYSLEVVK